jgi:hypothetical protein
MLHSSSPLKFVIVDTTKNLKHGNAQFISLQLLTEAFSIIHTEALAESMEGKAFETYLLPTELIALLLKSTKPLLM